MLRAKFQDQQVLGSEVLKGFTVHGYGGHLGQVTYIPQISLVVGKPAFCTVTAKLTSAIVFASPIVQSFFFLNPKFQASSHLLWLYSPVFVGPGKNPEDRFSHNEAQ